MMNGEAHGHDDREELALALVDRTLTAIGGLETTDPMRALDIVLAMYAEARDRLRD
ncbi:MAG: hypothetical protein NVS2B3_05470 [Vulcanimicrobiaceae bacterium]